MSERHIDGTDAKASNRSEKHPIIQPKITNFRSKNVGRQKVVPNHFRNDRLDYQEIAISRAVAIYILIDTKSRKVRAPLDTLPGNTWAPGA